MLDQTPGVAQKNAAVAGGDHGGGTFKRGRQPGEGD